VPEIATLFAFSLICLGMVMTPGPNMIYLISRAISQGRLAALISLGGVVLGFVLYGLFAVLGITALLLAVPYAYDTLRLAGAAYLLYLSWQTLKPGSRSAFQVRLLKQDSPAKLFSMGFLTSALNPKVAVLYMSLLPQFIDPAQGVIGQSLVFVGTQISVSIAGNVFFILLASRLAIFMRQRPFWASFQRWLMGTVLAGFAIRMALDSRR
jgi:threonine/homoserine/homoserine lactone efflux protein